MNPLRSLLTSVDVLDFPKEPSLALSHELHRIDMMFRENFRKGELGTMQVVARRRGQRQRAS
jgi:hypothetical protein